MVIDAIEEALQPIRQSLQADGYELIVNDFQGGVLSVEIQPGPHACVECLVPKELMELMIQQSLKTLAQTVHLQYPEQSEASH
jgi:hypothetical protein